MKKLNNKIKIIILKSLILHLYHHFSLKKELRKILRLYNQGSEWYKSCIILKISLFLHSLSNEQAASLNVPQFPEGP